MITTNRKLTCNIEDGRLPVETVLGKGVFRKQVIHQSSDDNIIAECFGRSNQKELVTFNVGGGMNTLRLTYTQQNFIDWLIAQRNFYLQSNCNTVYKDYGSIYTADNKVWVRTTQEKLASTLGCVRMTIIRAVKVLKEYGIIKTKKTDSINGNHTLCYTFTDEFLASKEYQVHNSIYNLSKVTQCYNLFIYSNKSYKSIGDFSSKKKEGSVVLPLKPKTTTAQDMLGMWNRYFPNSVMEMSKDLARYLVAAFKRKFNSLGAWNKYLEAIKHSAYLMGEKFKLFLNWAIKFRTIDRIMNGELGCPKYDYTDEEEKELNSLNEALVHIEVVEESKKCKVLRRKILQKTSPGIYLGWFAKVSLKEEDGDVYLETRSSFMHDYLVIHYSDLLNNYNIRIKENKSDGRNDG